MIFFEKLSFLLLTFFFILYILISRYAKTYFAALAQLVEHVICNLGVVGPNPTGSSIKGSWHSGTAGDCKSLGQPDGVRFPDFPSQTSKKDLARFFYL